MRQNTFFALFMLIFAFLLWVGFGVMVWQLSAERTRYATLQADIASREQAEELGTRLRTLVRDTSEEREILEALTQTDILTAVATIEAAGGASGARLSIQNVTEPQNGSGNVRTVTLSTRAEGSLAALVDTLVLLESLPFPAVIENVRISTNEGAEAGEGAWQMTTRIRIITTSPIGV